MIVGSFLRMVEAALQFYFSFGLLQWAGETEQPNRGSITTVKVSASSRIKKIF